MENNFKYITNAVLNHGLGSKILKLINLMGLVSLLNKINYKYEFIYTPLSYEGFGVNFHNNHLLEYYHKTPSNRREEYIKICNRWDDMINYKGKKIYDVNHSDTIFLVHPSIHNCTDIDVFNETKNIKQKIKNDFNLTKKSKKKYTDIKIHIRRADVDGLLNMDRWLNNDYYLNVIDKLKEKYKLNYKITIYTQRKSFNPNGFEDYDIVYDDETLDNEVWVDLINSDVLVISKSAYSYSSGILCDGLVIYPTDGMFHPKLNGWKTIDEI
jgi:hypothetical protein